METKQHMGEENTGLEGGHACAGASQPSSLGSSSCYGWGQLALCSSSPPLTPISEKVLECETECNIIICQPPICSNLQKKKATPPLRQRALSTDHATGHVHHCVTTWGLASPVWPTRSPSCPFIWVSSQWSRRMWVLEPHSYQNEHKPTFRKPR